MPKPEELLPFAVAGVDDQDTLVFLGVGHAFFYDLLLSCHSFCMAFGVFCVLSHFVDLQFGAWG